MINGKSIVKGAGMNETIIRNPMALNDDALGENFPEVPNPSIYCGENIPDEVSATNVHATNQ